MGDRGSGHDRGAPLLRLALSLFFILNFGSIGAYFLPRTDDPRVWGVPEPVLDVAGRVLPAVHATVWPVARRYLDATATRQHWTLFAPYPAEWTVSLDVVAHYPVLDGEDTEGPPSSWRADTIRVEGPDEVPYPHFLRHRHYRIVFNMGYEAWGAHYRLHYARWLCRTLRDARGRAPDGVSLRAVWNRVLIPWRDEEPERYEQFLGGFTCYRLLGRERPPYLVEVPLDSAAVDRSAAPAPDSLPDP